MADAVDAQALRSLIPPEPFNAARYCLSDNDTPRHALALTVATDASHGIDWSYGEIETAVLRSAAALLHRGIGRGDRVVLRIGNEPSFPIAFFACLTIGAIAVPTSTQLTPREVQGIVEDCGAVLAIVGQEHAVSLPCPSVAPSDLLASNDERAAYAPLSADAPGYIVYTSGSTGRPKGVLHAHRAVFARRSMWRGWYGLRADDVMLHAGAFNWTYTLGAGLMDPWAIGARTVIYTGEKDPSVWPVLAERFRPTLFAAVPSLYRQILKYGDNLKPSFASLRHGLTAGEALPEALRQTWRETVGCQLYEALGMSECSTFISSSPAVPVRPGTVGRAQLGRKVAVLPSDVASDTDGTAPLPVGEQGILAVHRDDPGLMLHYWNRDAEMAEVFRGPWFLTGDLVSTDPDGYISHHGRADDLMNAGGFRVAPQEVEGVFAGVEGVADCAVGVVEIPRPGHPPVEIVAAFVVPAAGANLTEEGLLSAAGKTLAAYKTPKAAVILASLPRSVNGKLRRKELNDIWQRHRLA